MAESRKANRSEWWDWIIMAGIIWLSVFLILCMSDCSADGNGILFDDAGVPIQPKLDAAPFLDSAQRDSEASSDLKPDSLMYLPGDGPPRVVVDKCGTSQVTPTVSCCPRGVDCNGDGGGSADYCDCESSPPEPVTDVSGITHARTWCQVGHPGYNRCWWKP